MTSGQFHLSDSSSINFFIFFTVDNMESFSFTELSPEHQILFERKNRVTEGDHGIHYCWNGLLKTV